MFLNLTSRLARLTAASLAAAMLAGPVLPSIASAAPLIDTNQPAPTPNSDPDPFYDVPTVIPEGANGDVIRARPAAAGPPTARELASAWQVMYLSTDANGKRNVVTGTVLVPKGTDPKNLPVVGFAPGTTGPAFRCTVSRFINSGAFYEQPAVNDMLKAGYAVAVTDYEGYHQNPHTSYINGKAMADAVLDAVRAATRLPQAGLSATPKVALRGYSQGGGATMWAATYAPTYAPELNIIGAAAGGVPADLPRVALGNEGKQGIGFVLNALIGLNNAYPELALDDFLTDTGRATLKSMEADDCTLELLTKYAGQSLLDYTPDIPFLDPSWLARLNENKLGTVKINVPVFQYHGTADTIVGFTQGSALRDKYCALGMNETWVTYPGVDHITGVARGNADVMAWLADRVAGKTATPNC